MRTMTTAAAAALAAPQVTVALLVDMAFSPALRLASSPVSIVWGGNTYLGAGSLGALDVVRDTSGDAQALQFTLSGVPSENLSLALSQTARGRACTIRLAILNAGTHVVEDAVLIGNLVLDQLTINGPTIGVSALPMARIFSRPKPLRYTDGDQQTISAGDRALEYLVSQSTHRDVWPAASWGRK